MLTTTVLFREIWFWIHFSLERKATADDDSSFRYRTYHYSVFHVTWTTFNFNRNQLGTVSAYVMISVAWSNQRAHQVISEKLLSKEFHCGTTDDR